MRLLLLLLLLPLFVHAEPLPGLQPMGFLAGNCWKGTFADGKRTDEHCFEWVYGGKALRDRHAVRTPGQPDYLGETVYYWDSEARQIQYLYFENMGGISRGVAEPAADGMTFPVARYIEDGQVMSYRARWTRAGADAYEVHNEIQGKDGWATAFRVKMVRQPQKP